MYANEKKEGVKDHKGNWYPNKIKMCKAYGIDYMLFSERMKRGWSIRQCLETPIEHGCCVIDHEGNQFHSEEEMADAWGINYSAYTYRRKRGWTLEEALTIPKFQAKNKERLVSAIQDLDVDDLEEAIRLFRQTYHRDIKKHNRRRRVHKSGPVTSCHDHCGNAFSSRKDMCEYWHISFTVFNNRTHDMWPLEYALTYPKGQYCAFYDHCGNEFRSIAKMCKFWNVPQSEFCDRMNDGWGLERSLCEKTPTPNIRQQNRNRQRK